MAREPPSLEPLESGSVAVRDNLGTHCSVNTMITPTISNPNPNPYRTVDPLIESAYRTVDPQIELHGTELILYKITC